MKILRFFARAILPLWLILFSFTPIVAQSGSVSPDDDIGLHRLLSEIERLVNNSGGIVGVGAFHIESGQSVWLNGDVRFPMASTYKVPIAVQLLSRVDRAETVSYTHLTLPTKA